MFACKSLQSQYCWLAYNNAFKPPNTYTTNRPHLFCHFRYYMLSGTLVCEQDMAKMMKSSPANNSSTPPVRKGKVGRPRRSRD